jgi:transcription initiation factor TFIID subunit 13
MMMYGFGDARNPNQQSIEVMESLTVAFLTDLCHRCRPSSTSLPTSRHYPYAQRAKVKMDDLRFALRKDEKKLARLEELIYLEGVISGAKKLLSNDVVDDVARQVEAEEKGEKERAAAARDGGGSTAMEVDGEAGEEDAKQGRPATQSKTKAK